MKKISSQLALFILTTACVVTSSQVMAQKDLLKTGSKAQAEILKEWQTPMSVNGQPVVGLELKVIPSSGNSFTVQIHERVSILQTSYYLPGSIVQVRYDSTALPIDPNKRTKKVIIESLGKKAEPATPSVYDDPKLMAQYTRELIKIDSTNKQIRASGVLSKAIILTYSTYKSLDLNVGGNPAITMDVQVIPENQPSFKATVNGVVLEAAVPKFQPGKIIFVKYDAKDLTKVTVDHSE